VTSIWYTGVGGDDAGYVRPALPFGVAATGDRIFGYTSWGAISSVTIPSEYSETYAFDGYARPTSVTRWILGQAYSIYKTYTTSYEYNQASQLTKMTYPSGQQVVVNHDDKGRVQSLSGLTGITYNIAGQVTGLTLGNGVVESYGYDANRLQLTTQTATKGADSLVNLTYNYQATAGQMGTGSTAGNAGQLMSNSGTINSTTESAAYTYDLLGRLGTSNQTSNGSSAQRRFDYDRWGNRNGVWNAVSGGTQIQSVTFPSTFQQGGSAPTNRIGSVTNNGSTVNYTYDAAGNVTNDGLHSYTYDAENRGVSVDGGATAQYRHDHQNRRVCKIIGSSWTHYIWEGSRVIGEHDATTAYSTNPTYQVNSARLDYIYSGARMIRSRQRASSTAPWVTQYYLNDRLSVRMTLDASGNVLGRESHLPFGEDFGESGMQEKHHFTSYERDSETSTDYAVNRQYAQTVGRFMSADPYRASGYMVDPQSWNRYSYTRNNPINRVDLLGLEDEGVPIKLSVTAPFWNPDEEAIKQGIIGTGGHRIIRWITEGEPRRGERGEAAPDPRKLGLDAARKALERQACRDLIAGVFGGDPLALFNKLLEKGQFVPGDPNDPNFVIDSHGHYSPAYTRRTGESATVVYDPGIHTDTRSSSGYFGWADADAKQYDITPAEAAALGFLHELSHATGKFVHAGDKPPSDQTQIIDDDTLNQRIYDACFKPEPKKKK